MIPCKEGREGRKEGRLCDILQGREGGKEGKKAGRCILLTTLTCPNHFENKNSIKYLCCASLSLVTKASFCQILVKFNPKCDVKIFDLFFFKKKCMCYLMIQYPLETSIEQF